MLIRKLLVAQGIYYVEIPAAGVYMLCGSPADSVKHLLRRGLIQKVEASGVEFENGPNTQWRYLNAASILSFCLINGFFSS